MAGPRPGWAFALSLVAVGCLILAALQSGAGGGAATALYGEMARPMGSLQLEPEHWASEDSAEHAFNLELWRTEVLKAKVAQADLRKKLFAASSVPQVEGQDDSWRRRRDAAPPQQLAAQPAPQGGDAALAAEAAEIKGLRKDLLGVASQTANALSHLKNTVKGMKYSDERRSARRRAPAQSLRRAPEEVHTMGHEEAARRQRKEREAQRVPEEARRGRDAGRGEEAAKRVRVSTLRAKMEKMLGSLTQAVTLAEQDKQARGKATREKTLEHLEKTEGTQLKALAGQVEAAVYAKNAHARKRAEAASIARTLSSMETAAGKAVHGARHESGARKAARVVAVKKSADTALDALLTKVDREIARKKWRESLPPLSRPA